MRVLMSFVGGTGHFLPTLPIARALAARGHDVGYTCQQGMTATVGAAGFAAVDSGGRTLADPATRRSLVAVDRAAEAAVLRDSFAGRVAAARAPRIVALAREIGADVLVHDEIDFAATAAAHVLGVADVPVVVTAAGGFVTAGLVGPSLGRLCSSLGAPAPDTGALLRGALTVAPVMPSFRDPAFPLPAATLAIRPDVLTPDPSDSGSPAAQRVLRWRAGSDAPLVHVTLGTIFHQESGDLFARVITALTSLPVRAAVTVGREIDPAELGPLPADVLVERYVPSSVLLPRAAVVVSHAGSGTTVAALACGVPLVLLPLGADQPWNADRCATLGVARVLDPMTATSSDIAAAVRDVLGDPGFRSRAAVLRDEATALPGADVAAEQIEGLVPAQG